MGSNLDEIKLRDGITVHELEKNFSDSLIGVNFSLKDDVVTILYKSAGFGIKFFSKKYDREFFLPDHEILRQVKG